MEKTFVGQATEDLIAKWKQEFKKVFTYKVDGKIGYLRPVDRDLYSLASAKMRESSPAKFTETLINGVWLGGCDELKNDDRYYFGLADFVETLLDKKKGELGEL